MKFKYLIIDFIAMVLYGWSIIVFRLGYELGLMQFRWSEAIILNFIPIYGLGAFIWALTLSAIRIYLTDRKHFSLDLAIIFLIYYAILFFIPPISCIRLNFIEFLIILFIPFMTWLGTLTWAIILIIYRMHLMERERNLRN